MQLTIDFSTAARIVYLHLSDCMFICPSVCMCVCLPVCTFVCLSVCLTASVCFSGFLRVTRSLLQFSLPACLYPCLFGTLSAFVRVHLPGPFCLQVAVTMVINLWHVTFLLLLPAYSSTRVRMYASVSLCVCMRPYPCAYVCVRVPFVSASSASAAHVGEHNRHHCWRCVVRMNGMMMSRMTERCHNFAAKQ